MVNAKKEDKICNLSEKDLDCLVAYRIDTHTDIGVLRKLRLLATFRCGFSDIARGKELYENAKRR